ncbi:MAG: TlpA disulfide reductase family protein, partial [Thermodesulfobacteriota bacterium]
VYLSNFYLPDTQGRMVNISEFKGRVIMLNFWATWCPPCRQEIPDLIALQQELGPKGLSVVSISLDHNPPEEVHRFSRENNINYPVLYAGDRAEQIVEKMGGFQGIPTTFLINREGQVIGSISGVAPKEAWAKEIRKHL